MDYDVGSHNMAFIRGPTFHNLIYVEINLQSLWAPH